MYPTVYKTSGFGGRPGSDLIMSYIFPQSMLAAITLVGHVLKTEGLDAEPGFLLCSVANTTQLGAKAGPKFLKQKSLRLGLVGFVPEYMLFPSPSMGPFPPEVSDAGTRGVRAGV